MRMIERANEIKQQQFPFGCTCTRDRAIAFDSMCVYVFYVATLDALAIYYSSSSSSSSSFFHSASILHWKSLWHFIALRMRILRIHCVKLATINLRVSSLAFHLTLSLYFLSLVSLIHHVLFKCAWTVLYNSSCILFKQTKELFILASSSQIYAQ